jgi:hypothetical protein
MERPHVVGLMAATIAAAYIQRQTPSTAEACVAEAEDMLALAERRDRAERNRMVETFLDRPPAPTPDVPAPSAP